MARKTRNLASFEDLANNNIKKNINDNDGINENNIVSDNINDTVNKDININDIANVDNSEYPEKVEMAPEMDYLDKLIEGKVQKADTGTILTGVYLQKDLVHLLDRLAKKGGRGAKSKIVNEALRSVFSEKGLL